MTKKGYTKKGYNAFVAYSDPEAGERGVLYRACNFLYCGTTSPTEKFRTPSGEIKDTRLVSAYCRDRTGGKMKYRRSRAAQKKLLIEQGCEIFKDSGRTSLCGNLRRPTHKTYFAKRVAMACAPIPQTSAGLRGGCSHVAASGI
jgi:hypothetical protein